MTRAAIVGLGPKGLFALERLLNRARPGLEVDVYEPHAAPGAGPVYDPAQPAYLRMNYRDELIDLWPADHALVPPAERRTYVAWHSEQGIVNEIEDYSARADVGRYLHDGFRTLLRHAPDGVRVTVRPRRVEHIDRDDGRWTIEGERYDEVLLATGHSGIGPTLPSDPGRRLAVRGFALTFIDVALAMTEGRGGRFEPGDRARLRFVGGDDDVTIVPFSRSGRPMLVKPRQNHVPDHLPEFASVDGLVAAIAVTAASVLGAEADRIAAALERVAAGERWPTPLDPAAELAESLDIALGARRPDAASAVGTAWRALYPSIVARFSHATMNNGDWHAFRVLAREMERMAFGPPAGNAARVLALVEAGRIDLSGLTRGPDPRADSVIDAVLPPPGAAGPLLDGLIAAGHVRVADGRRGLDVGEDGTCRRADGGPAPGLAAIGRPTEDVVIGNDTLSRTLHPAADRWAARVSQAEMAIA